MEIKDAFRDRTAQVLYGSETGNSQEIAEELGRMLERLRFSTNVNELDSALPTSLSTYTLSIFAVSTTGQGDFPENSQRFWKSLLRKKLQPNYLAGVRFALVGLGDSSYPKFNWAARKFQKRLKQLGANEVFESCEADEQGEEGTDGAFITWLQRLRPQLLEQFCLPEGAQPIPDHVRLPSRWGLQYLAEKVPDEWYNGSVFETTTESFSEGTPDTDCRPIAGSVWATLKSNLRLTPTSHWQDVRLLTLVTDKSLPYFPGDSLAITPKNFVTDVFSLISLMQWEHVADRPISIAPTDPNADLSQYPSKPIQNPLPGSLLTLRSLLINHLDITAIPRRSFFAAIAQYTSDSFQKERLLEFANPEYLDDYYDYATRPRRSILEILQEFDTVKIPWQEAANVFPTIRARQFSIASGGALKAETHQNSTRFELLVAVVKYRTVIKQIRQGVCTRYLAALPEASTLNVVLKTEGRFQKKPTELRGSHILIGAGTGLAPLRALIYEKENLLKQGGSVGSTCLFFGCRSQDSDYFFKDTWKECNLKHDFRIFTAFSRDQREKVYVQDRLKQHAQLVFDKIHRGKATVIVCGSSGAMPKAVREALLHVLVQGGTGDGNGDGGAPGTREEAEAYLAGMERAGTFKQETW
ncbi:MAG: hypothetical protein Q9227_002940 [Pyrenula ochraceoflavens]